MRDIQIRSVLRDDKRLREFRFSLFGTDPCRINDNAAIGFIIHAWSFAAEYGIRDGRDIIVGNLTPLKFNTLIGMNGVARAMQLAGFAVFDGCSMRFVGLRDDINEHD